ncbi:carboxypeptidase-like regulatory domain-containing protein [Verrucosispora sp. WMMD573]|uniref:carboxypeptidase-like regulatory domain-containing protein n=1 Tax=Verrucosispora sp. WMMD573 TaxID=3015149 RepID=UPI00248BA07A|nr:carboxypeptidase-like regulatory domain-containing protein [Verrucosispora sp. WMMD573]WBB52545.1 carboxypeptidase-like regulatory domain-containing protein [Verrucosispora sp. WMMD573]
MSRRGWTATVAAVMLVAGVITPGPATAAPSGITPPSPPSSVSSDDYPNDGTPSGGVDVTGTFEVTAPAVRPGKVKEYAYSLDSGVLIAAETVPARTSDRGATISVSPKHDGINVLWVWSRDRAGRISAPVTYRFTVRADSGPGYPAVPLPPAITFPNGSEVSAGGQLTVTFDAEGDTDVTSFRYSIDGTGLGSTVPAISAGGSATVVLDVGNVSGSRPIYAVAVDDNGSRVSGLSQGEFTVLPATSLAGTVWDAYFLPQAGAVITLRPGDHQATSGADGGYAFTDLTRGAYTVTATLGDRCVASFALEIDSQGQTVDIFVPPVGEGSDPICSD